MAAPYELFDLTRSGLQGWSATSSLAAYVTSVRDLSRKLMSYTSASSKKRATVQMEVFRCVRLCPLDFCHWVRIARSPVALGPLRRSEPQPAIPPTTTLTNVQDIFDIVYHRIGVFHW